MVFKRRLYLLRHAHALSQSDFGDKERSLSSQGKADARVLGEYMNSNGFAPDIVLCSSAVRTRQTLEGVNQSLEVTNIQFADILYNGSTGDYLYQIQRVSDDYRSILFIAHNPCIYELVCLLAAQGDDALLGRLSMGYSPATLSVIECDIGSWKDIQPVENTLTALVSPTDYNSGS